jgi:hypothetical protein
MVADARKEKEAKKKQSEEKPKSPLDAPNEDDDDEDLRRREEELIKYLESTEKDRMEKATIRQQRNSTIAVNARKSGAATSRYSQVPAELERRLTSPPGFTCIKPALFDSYIARDDYIGNLEKQVFCQ